MHIQPEGYAVIQSLWSMYLSVGP